MQRRIAHALRYVVLGLLVGCTHHDRPRELAQCKVATNERAEGLARCLVLQHDWDPDSARYAELHVLAEENRQARELARQRDSVAAVLLRRERTRRVREAMDYCRSLGVVPKDCDTSAALRP